MSLSRNQKKESSWDTCSIGSENVVAIHQGVKVGPLPILT